jgi:hypothetical protein
VRAFHPNGLPGPGWYERWEGIVSGVPPHSCWLCGSTLTFVHNGRHALCPRCDVPANNQEDHALLP